MNEEFQYDVFLSHNGADKLAVEYLAQKLCEAGLEPFLDKWHLIPGEPWQEAIEAALDQSRTCAVFLGPNGLGPWENEEMRSALEDRVRDKARHVIPVLLPGAPDSQDHPLPRFLRRLTWVDFRKGLEDSVAFQRLVSGIKGTVPNSGNDLTQPGQKVSLVAVEQQDFLQPFLKRFNLQKEADPRFGTSDLTARLLQVQRSLKSAGYQQVQSATSAVVLLSIPSVPLKATAVTVIRTALELFQPDRWYDIGHPGRRYYAREIFPLSRHAIRTTRTEVIVEQVMSRPSRDLLIDILKATQDGVVAYATSFHVFDEFLEGPRIFRLGAICNFLWSFLCLVWELYENVSYAGDSHVCVAMVNTKDSLLGHFAKGWPEPYDRKDRDRQVGTRRDETCRDLNIRVCRDVSFATFQSKVEPRILYEVAEEIALAYNQTEPRCFDPSTGKLMEYRLHM